MRQSIFIALFSLCYLSTFSQVVNTEKLRLDQPGKNFILEADINLGLTSNKAGESSRYGFRLRGEFDKGKNRLLFFSGGNQTRFVGRSEGSVARNFVNNRFAHLRYNYDFNPSLTLEAFSQIQTDEIQLIKNRILSGTGLRLMLIKNDTASLYLGAIMMFEYEEEFKVSDEPMPTEIDIINRDPRASFYVSAAYAFTSYFNINHVTYYQPNVTDFSDFRISSESIVTVAVSKKVSFKTYLQFIYDSRPPDPVVPNTMYSITTGLGFTL
ncbi:MAG: DUF481 domain-containing protein [Bacteroidia bacterium]|nr:DUF481 domain-containing protein [Bacteroidia bacterium]